MSKNLAKRGELEAKYRDVGDERHEDLADDVIFEPSLSYEGRRVAIAIKDSVQVCWNCHAVVKPNSCLDAIMGEGVVVRICEDGDCRRKLGDENRDRNQRKAAGKVVMLDDLDESEREEIAEEILEKKKKYRGF